MSHVMAVSGVLFLCGKNSVSEGSGGRLYKTFRLKLCLILDYSHFQRPYGTPFAVEAKGTSSAEKDYIYHFEQEIRKSISREKQ